MDDYSRRGGGGGRGRRGVPLSDLDPALTSSSHTVIGCARDVHVALGPGYPKEVYVEALASEMKEQGVSFEQDAAFEVYYGDATVGQVKGDFFIDDRFIVTVLSQPREIGSYERSELRALLRAGDLELGLIINFAGRRLKDGLVRVLNPDKLDLPRDGDDGHDDDDDE